MQDLTFSWRLIVFRIVLTYSVVDGHQLFGGTFYLFLHGRRDWGGIVTNLQGRGEMKIVQSHERITFPTLPCLSPPIPTLRIEGYNRDKEIIYSFNLFIAYCILPNLILCSILI